MTKQDDIKLREYLELQINNLSTYLQLTVEKFSDVISERFSAHNMALDLASKNLDARLDKLNELREAVTAQENRYSTKAESEMRFGNVEKDVRALLLAQSKMEGKASQNAVLFSMGIGLFGVLLSAIALLLRLMGK